MFYEQQTHKGCFFTTDSCGPKLFAKSQLLFLHSSSSPCPPMSLKPPDKISNCDPEPYTSSLDCWQAKWSR